MSLDLITARRLILAYNDYIQDANDDDKFAGGWRPVCVGEFYGNEFQEIIKN